MQAENKKYTVDDFRRGQIDCLSFSRDGTCPVRGWQLTVIGVWRLDNGVWFPLVTRRYSSFIGIKNT